MTPLSSKNCRPAAVVLLEQLAKPPHKQHSTVEDYALAERFAGLTTIGLTTTYGSLGPASAKLLRRKVQRDQDRYSSATMRNFSTPQRRLQSRQLLQLHASCHAQETCKHQGATTEIVHLALLVHLRACALKLFSFHLFNPYFGAHKPGCGRLLRLPVDTAATSQTCPGRSTKLFAFQCRKRSPVSQLRNSIQHSRANAPPSPCRQCCLE